MENEKTIDPRMHTAEHLLNQTMIRLFGVKRCFSAHIEKKKSKCDYRFDRALTEAETNDLSDKINGIISADLPVTEEFMPLPEASKKFDLSRLPEGTSADPLRIIKVGDYDACPCAGPHVASTKEVGAFRVISTSFEAGVLRIRYKLA